MVLELVLATGNAHKLAELTAILAAAGLPVRVLPPSAVDGMPEVVEDAGTFEGNARKKALALAARLQTRDVSAADHGGHNAPEPAKSFNASAPDSARSALPRSLAVADDSGLCVDALGGAPGVDSAYYAGHPRDDAANNAKLLAALRDVPAAQRTAAFHCCIVAAAADGRSFVFHGRCPGRVLTTPRGVGGFGYDPLFVPDGQERTAAELPPEVKNRISHRARALEAFIRWLRQAMQG